MGPSAAEPRWRAEGGGGAGRAGPRTGAGLARAPPGPEAPPGPDPCLHRRLSRLRQPAHAPHADHGGGERLLPQQEWTFDEHSGTHMDAPGHFISDGRRVTELRPRELFAPAVVIDISARVASDPDAEVERRPAQLRTPLWPHPRGAVVFMYSGWGGGCPIQRPTRTPTPAGPTYAGLRPRGPGMAAQRRASRGSGWTPSASTQGLDHVRRSQRLLGADRYGLENVANLKSIPPRGAHLVVGVIPWEE